VDQGGPRPSDADLVEGTAYAGATHLVVDDELGDRIGIEAPRTGPVRGHVPRRGELACRRTGIVFQPPPELDPGPVSVSGEGEVHEEPA
jgi:hypothetical protein